MKRILTITIFFLLIFFLKTNTSFAATYYVSSTDGNDTCTGLSQTTYTTGLTACPIKTLTKLNTKTFSPGDNILFKKGDTFYGSITINQSGTDGNPITFSSYGTGNQPIITGFTDVAEWTNKGNNIWESTNAVSTLSTLNMVTVNGVNTAMGRYPNADAENGGYLTVNSHSGSTSLTSSSLTGTPNWTGAEAVVRTTRWRLERAVIISQSTSTISFSLPDPNYSATDGNGFFIQNDIRTLDQQNEWYYNPSTKKISVYSVGQPNEVKVASIDKIFNPNCSYITIDGLYISGANSYSIYNILSGKTNLTIKNTNVLYSGVNGIHLQSTNLLIDNSIVSESNNNGIDLSTGAANTTITNSIVQNSGFIPGMGLSNDGSYVGLNIKNEYINGFDIENNQILNSGYHAISFYGDSVIIKNNYINTFNTVKDDGGGIYTWGGSRTNISIQNNVILNGIGAALGTNRTYAKYSEGIYLDDNTSNAMVSGNTISNCGDAGIFLHNTNNITVTGNISYNNKKQFSTSDDSLGGMVANNLIENNIFISKLSSQKVGYFYANTADTLNSHAIPFIGTLNYNYWAKPIGGDSNLNYMVVLNSDYSEIHKTFEEWQTYSGQDLNSKKSPVSISSESDIFFDYNASTSSKTVTLPWPSVDMDGVKHTGNVTIAPYGSVIYLKDPAPGDTTKPVISSFTIPTTSSSLSISGISLVASDNIAVTGYLLSESSTTPSPSSGSWSSTPQTSYTFSTSGSKTLYAFAKDAAGNVSNYASDTIVITLPPVTATTYTLTGPSSGNINTSSTNFTITPNNTYTGTITITPSGTGSTGLTPIIKTFSSSSTPQTFTITPTVARSITLTPSNNGGLTNPANLTYTSTTPQPNTYTLTYTANANGTISGTSIQTVNSGASGTAVTATPNTGYHFVSWSDSSTTNPRIDTNVTANKSVSASFAIDAVTPPSSGGGGGGGGGGGTPTLTLSDKAKAKDIKQDGSINIIDFNIIMANWNKPYSTSISLSKGDITGDGIINIFDMNQLMVYWGIKY